MEARELNDVERDVFCFLARKENRFRNGLSASPSEIAFNLGLDVDHVFIAIKALEEMGRLHIYRWQLL